MIPMPNFVALIPPNVNDVVGLFPPVTQVQSSFSGQRNKAQDISPTEQSPADNTRNIDVVSPEISQFLCIIVWEGV